MMVNCSMCNKKLGNGEHRICCNIIFDKKCYKKHYKKEHNNKKKKELNLKRKTQKAEKYKVSWNKDIEINISEDNYRSLLKYRANKALKEGRGGEFTHLIKEIENIKPLTEEEMVEISE